MRNDRDQSQAQLENQPRIMLVVFIPSRERQEPAELQALVGILENRETMAQRGHQGGLGSEGRR